MADEYKKPTEKPVDWFQAYVQDPYNKIMGEKSAQQYNQAVGEGVTKNMDRKKANDFVKGFNGG